MKAEDSITFKKGSIQKVLSISNHLIFTKRWHYIFTILCFSFLQGLLSIRCMLWNALKNYNWKNLKMFKVYGTFLSIRTVKKIKQSLIIAYSFGNDVFAHKTFLSEIHSVLAWAKFSDSFPALYWSFPHNGVYLAPGPSIHCLTPCNFLPLRQRCFPWLYFCFPVTSNH